ncbi:phage head closure protein [Atlantibacter hermannii]|uniref:phage head closure protein n=1 Tax=Atlantibacter hermannii TaxID=565 RepID=UPI00289C4096|nr:phage head closure protein [Atlantibacter hermannii]
MKIRQAQTSATYLLPDPGELDKRIRLCQRVDRALGDYDSTQEYINPLWAWAKVRQVSATVMHESAQTDQAITHYFTIRFRRGITSDYEVLYGGMVYAVRRARDLNNERRFLLLECEELREEHPAGGDMYG